MNLDRGLYKIAKDLRADDRRRAAENRRTAEADRSTPTPDRSGPLPRRRFLAGLRRRAGQAGWLRA